MANAYRRELTIVLTGDARGLTGTVRVTREQMRELGAELDRTGNQATQAGQRTSRAFATASRDTDHFSRAVGAARNQLLALVSVAALVQVGRGLIQMADTYTNIGARLRLASAGTVSFAQAQASALGVAQRTSSSLVTTADLIAKLSTSFRSLGGDATASFRTAVTLSEEINKAVALSGASAAAADAALTQLGQGLASGTLRGDELNSVLEQTPRLAQAIADGMGVSIGQLRAMGMQGKITTDVILAALRNQAAVIDKEFSQLPLTVGRAWEKLRTNVLSYVGLVDQSNGASKRLADRISSVAAHVDDIARAIVLLGEVVATVYASKLLYSGALWISNLAAQSAAVAANGVAIEGWGAKTAASFANARQSIGLLGIALNLVASAVVGWEIGSYLRDQFVEVRLAGVALVDGLLTAWERIKEGAQLAFTAVTFAATGSFDEIRAGLSDMLGSLGQVLQKLPDSMAKGVGVAWMALAAGLHDAKTEGTGYAQVAAKIRAESEANIATIHRTTDEMADYEIAQAAAARATEKTTKAVVDGFKPKAADVTVTTAQTNALAAYAAQTAALANQTDDARAKLAGLTDAQLTFRRGVRDAVNGYNDLVAGGASAAEANNYLSQRMAALNDQFRVNSEAASQAAAATDHVAAAQASGSLVANDYYRALADGAQRASDAIANYLVREVHSLADMWKGLVQTARQVVAQIISTWLRLRVIQPLLGSIFGGGYGGGGLWGTALTAVGSLFGSGSGSSAGGGSSAGIGAGGTGAADSNPYGSWLSNISQARSLYNWAFGGSAVAGDTALSGSLATGYSTGSQVAAANLGRYGASPSIYSGIGVGSTGTPAPYGGYIGNTGLSYAGVAGGLAGAYWGSQRGSGGISTGAATVTGALGGYYAGAAAATAISGGVAAGLASIPVVGWIALAAMLVDQVGGGKLFGTKYRPTAATTSLALGPEGASAEATLTEKKQRALFGGAKWRTKDIAATSEMQQAAQALYDSVEKTMVQGARKLGVDVPAMIRASLDTNVTLNDKGQVRSTEYVVRYLGQTWKEATAEAAAKRIGAEALVTTVAASAGQVAQTIAQQWRDSADTLLEGAQLMLTAQADIRKGNSLVALGATATLRQVVAFVQEMQAEGESLADTYARLAQASAQYLQFVGQFKPQALGFGGSLQAIAQQMQANIDQANALAQAAGLQHAREADLAAIHQYAAQQAAAAIAQLSSAAQDLATKLYGATGNTLNAVLAQIDKLQGKVQSATQLAIGDNSPLSTKEKLDLALKGLRSGITSADEVLGLGRQLYASSADYTGLYNKVQEILGLPSATGGAGGGSVSDALDQYNQLIGQRDQYQAQADKLARFNDAKTLAQYVADISTTHGIGYAEAAKGLGFSLQALAKDLGLTNVAGYLDSLKLEDISGTTLTASTAIVDAIRQLGRDLIQTITGGPLVTPGPVSSVPAAPADAQQLALLKQINERLGAIEQHTGNTSSSNDELLRNTQVDRLRSIAGGSRSARTVA